MRNYALLVTIFFFFWYICINRCCVQPILCCLCCAKFYKILHDFRYSEVVPHLLQWEAGADAETGAALMRTTLVLPPNSACVVEV